MQDPIMFVSALVFGALFLFIATMLLVSIFSQFSRRVYPDFEPDISVVVPAYNEEKNIMQCIDSIFNSQYPANKIEVIVVDDGSTDSTLKLLKKDSRIQVLRQDHKGKVAALNLGTKKSKNEIIAVIDADTSLDKHCLNQLVRPFSDLEVGATTGTNVVRNNNNILTAFQNIEYHFLSLIAGSFSKLFNNGIWFFGSLACYRKSVLEKIGYFKYDSETEDHDAALEIKRAGLRTINLRSAIGHTIVPSTFKSLFKQRRRWWVGSSQTLIKNRSLFKRFSLPVQFVYLNHFWWSFYSIVSLPLIIYQINFWLPNGNAFALGSYLFKWFSLLGPISVLYNLPSNGVSMYSIFGVLSGIMTSTLSISALKNIKERLHYRNILAIFFYFPYTIGLNMIILVSIITNKFWKKSVYVK